MAFRGDRLVFHNGILALIALSAVIIVFCGGDTTLAINLYAVGVFMAFSLSQFGMVRYWFLQRGLSWQWRALMNGCGGFFTSLVLLVVVVSKFRSGAWLVVLLIPALVWLLAWVRNRYNSLEQALDLRFLSTDDAEMEANQITGLVDQDPGQGPILVCLEDFDRAALATVRRASSMSRLVTVLFVHGDHHDPERIQADWDRLVGKSLGLPLLLEPSHYGSFINPLVDKIREIERQEPDQRLTVMMPEVITPSPIDNLLLNQSVDLVSHLLADGCSRLFSRCRYILHASPDAAV